MEQKTDNSNLSFDYNHITKKGTAYADVIINILLVSSNRAEYLSSRY